jgi:hypothetical protein
MLAPGLIAVLAAFYLGPTPFYAGFFLQPLIPAFRISERIFEKRYKINPEVVSKRLLIRRQENISTNLLISRKKKPTVLEFVNSNLRFRDLCKVCDSYFGDARLTTLPEHCIVHVSESTGQQSKHRSDHLLGIDWLCFQNPFHFPNNKGIKQDSLLSEDDISRLSIHQSNPFGDLTRL